MKRFNLFVVFLVVLGLVASATLLQAAEKKAKAPAKAATANVEGKWYFTVVTPQGSGNPVVTFKQAGEKLTGHYAGSIGEAPLTGTIKGNDLEFSFVTDPKKGPAIYKGKVDGNKVAGDVDFAGVAKGTFTGEKIVKKK
jgi:hypothetical protein